MGSQINLFPQGVREREIKYGVSRGNKFYIVHGHKEIFVYGHFMVESTLVVYDPEEEEEEEERRNRERFGEF